MRYTSKHYKVEISVRMEEMPGCCGGDTLSSFTVEGPVHNITKEQKEKIYDDLMLQLIDGVDGTVVAMDAITSTYEGDWGHLDRSGGTDRSSYSEGNDCGDVTLEDFCRHHDFDFVGHAANRNSGNIVCAMVKSIRVPQEGGDWEEDYQDDVVIYSVDTPDFSDDIKEEPPVRAAANSADVADIIAQLREVVSNAA